MGLVGGLEGKRICIDTAPVIYFIEKHPEYSSLLHPVFAEIDGGNIEAITSTLTLLEVLVLPFKTGNTRLAERYREILMFSEGFTTFAMLNEVSELAAEIRARHEIKTPDSIQIATGVLYEADCFLTNDSALKKVSQEIEVVVLDDFL